MLNGISVPDGARKKLAHKLWYIENMLFGKSLTELIL